ncbi:MULTISPECIES: TetR/AcrR family transcriptional regulator [Streptomyces]|uniref:TetR/AcrR family transcriptional regulator n=2 Tax=Streptomyces rimosus subsp. rimosus TaxID=132474 RepID=L8ER45_STRR1|nr:MULTISPECIES: TetR/AcrR family transcriptional regulator [Streptomyces]KOG67442.1 TetR family transcriptional regulator [Kitasatospora aureofaciens]MYT45229.1 TetR family transcriptional regulator [Streptomyces sp. SID5471]KEF09174.1 TetR family transcriptional regulator [Streptomyces rimosus]KEF19195.1 TetR family transcriptional regulator [Streptomyces rimosus]KUJ26490.1 TetR family transcriptional regulator [Streptomyces rimosus subsp. rimosus]
MPKKVDHEARRREISEALWRIASTRGLEGASLRDVAAEAGMSLGRLQHYFRTKDEMLLFALRYIESLAQQRIRESIEALGREPTPRDIVRACLVGMLPLDEQSRTGFLVGVAHFHRAVHDPALRTGAQEGIPALRGLFADQLRKAMEQGEVRAERDADDEAMVLICLADGLSTYILLDVHTPEKAVQLLDMHLSQLFDGAGAR